MKEKIALYPAEVLRKKAGKIKLPLSAEIRRLVPLMVKLMREAKGMGLAAPQIGKSIQLFVTEDVNSYSGTKGSKKSLVFVNPKITAKSKNKNIAVEGCLSIPQRYIKVNRHETIKVRYLNENGEQCKIKATGLFARIIQHEIDHLNGVLIIDRS